MIDEYPRLYEINTRPWLKKFGENTRLEKVPDKYWHDLADKGINMVWLMGIWETTPSSIEEYCFHPDLINAYNHISEDWNKKDISGSPYAIEDYIPAKNLVTKKNLKVLKKKLNRLGLKLILDFIPNHFNAHCALTRKHPEVFLTGDEQTLRADPHTFFKREDIVFTHGKDPYFPAWTDTLQVNYFSKYAADFMIEKLEQVAEMCDGVRCDMAMLMLSDVFQKTWGFLGIEKNYDYEFWDACIDRIRSRFPHFIFIAEAYWDTPWRLQQMGFDYTYDKTLLDLIIEEKYKEIKAHLGGDISYHRKTIKFIENHDEERSLKVLGFEKAQAAAVLFSTVPGLKLYYDGQWVGSRVKYPVQLGRFFPEEDCPCTTSDSLPEIPCVCMHVFYSRLLDIMGDAIYRKGNWSQIADGGNDNLIAMKWSLGNIEHFIFINFDKHKNRYIIDLPPTALRGTVVDLLSTSHNPTFAKRTGEGLDLKLPTYRSCILTIKDQN